MGKIARAGIYGTVLSNTGYAKLEIDLSVARTDKLIVASMQSLRVLGATAGATYEIKLVDRTAVALNQADLPIDAELNNFAPTFLFLTNSAQADKTLTLLVLGRPLPPLEFDLQHYVRERCEGGITQEANIYDKDPETPAYGGATAMPMHGERVVIVWDLKAVEAITCYYNIEVTTGADGCHGYIDSSKDGVNWINRVDAGPTEEKSGDINIICRYLRWKILNDTPFDRDYSQWWLQYLWAERLK